MPGERTIHSIVSDPEALLTLEPEELAGVILECLNSLQNPSSGQLNRYNFTLPNGGQLLSSHQSTAIALPKRSRKHGFG